MRFEKRRRFSARYEERLFGEIAVRRVRVCPARHKAARKTSGRFAYHRPFFRIFDVGLCRPAGKTERFCRKRKDRNEFVFFRIGYRSRHRVPRFDKVRRKKYVPIGKARDRHRPVTDERVDRIFITVHVFFEDGVFSPRRREGRLQSTFGFVFAPYHAAAAASHIVYGFYDARKAEFPHTFFNKIEIALFFRYAEKFRRGYARFRKLLPHPHFAARVAGSFIGVTGKSELFTRV